MPKIRTLKAEYFRDEDLSYNLIVKALGAGLVCCMADDEGRFKASAGAIKGEVFTHDAVTNDDIDDALSHLEATGFVRLYVVEGRRYGAILNWKRHQPVPPSRFTPSNLPPAPPQADRKHGAGTRLRDRSRLASTAQADASSRAGSHTDARGRKGRGKEGEEERSEGYRLHAPRARARETDPDDLDEPDLPVEVLARSDLLFDAFDGADGLLRRPIRSDERPVLLGWAQLARDGTLVPLDEIVQLARRLLGQPTREGPPPATLRFIEASVQTLARGPVANGTANGAALGREMDEMVARLEAKRAAEGKA